LWPIDKVYQLLAHDRWFSPGNPASSTTKTGRHDIAEILLKVVSKHQKSIKNISVVVTIIKLILCLLSYVQQEEFEDTKGVIKLKLCLLSSVQQEEFEDTKGG
jgi:hypothetical protein